MKSIRRQLEEIERQATYAQRHPRYTVEALEKIIECEQEIRRIVEREGIEDFQPPPSPLFDA